MEKARIVAQPYMIRHLALRILMAVERPWSPVFYVCIIFLIAIQKNVSVQSIFNFIKIPFSFVLRCQRSNAALTNRIPQTAAEARKDKDMNKDKLTGVEKSIHAAVETFQKNLCREMAKRLDEGKLILDMETEVSFTTANVDEFIEEQIQELCGTLKPMEETLGADTAQKSSG